MTKGDKVYNSKLEVVLDPRAKFTVEDRKAQFDLANKLAAMLNHMSWGVDAIIGVRDTANQDAGKLNPNDPLRQRLTKLAADVDVIRGKIVATKEGGAITGEERLREFLGGVYGDVTGYEGRPTDSQVARADVLGRELDDVIRDFQTLAGQQLPALNKQLSSKKLAPIQVISEADWQKAQTATSASPSPGTTGRMREMD
jgi:hypothetical protein